jgi:hypothetical protein
VAKSTAWTVRYPSVRPSCATDQHNSSSAFFTVKVPGSIPDEVIGFFNWPNTSSRTMALGSTQPLTEMGSRNLPGGKGRSERKADLTTICEPLSRKCESLNVLQTYGPPRPLTGIALPVPWGRPPLLCIPGLNVSSNV